MGHSTIKIVDKSDTKRQNRIFPIPMSPVFQVTPISADGRTDPTRSMQVRHLPAPRCSYLHRSRPTPISSSHRLSRSRLKPSLLFTLLTTPSLKNFSSPAAVLPPMYHLSAPRTSRKPSLLLSLPRRRGDERPGIGIPLPLPAAATEDGALRGECMATPGEERPAGDDVAAADWE